MKKMFILLFLLANTGLFAQEGNSSEEEKAAIKSIIQSAYAEGLISTGTIEAVRKGFHQGFELLIFKDNTLEKFPIYNWIESVEKKKAEGKYPKKEKIVFQYPLIDITGNAAIAKVEFYIDGKLTFMDYLSLYKFSEGWKIVSKIYYKYPESQ